MNALKLTITGLFALAILGCSSGKKIYSTEEYKNHVAASIADRNFTIDVTRAMPQQGRSLNLSSRYSVTIKGDTLHSWLPYFGRAYRLPYGGGEGLTFDASITNYVVTTAKKDVTNIKFSVKTFEDSYDYSIDISDEGWSYISVSPNNKQGISFTGRLRLPEDEQ